nr:hypothetical protein [bacterium]
MGIFGFGKAMTATTFMVALEQAKSGYSNSGRYSKDFTDYYVKKAQKSLLKLMVKDGEDEITKEGWVGVATYAEDIAIQCDEAGDEESKRIAESINRKALRILSSM